MLSKLLREWHLNGSNARIHQYLFASSTKFTSNIMRIYFECNNEETLNAQIGRWIELKSPPWFPPVKRQSKAGQFSFITG